MSGKQSGAAETRITRRDVIKTSGAVGVGGLIAGCSGQSGDGGGSTDGDEGPIKLGMLEDQSGNFAQTGIQKWHAQKLAIEEINDDGGILGREIELLDPDPQSDNDRYQELARRLIQQDNVDVLFAGFASSSREAVRPVVDANQQLYFYTNQYEGGVCDTYTWCTGAVPEQQITPVLPSLVDEFGEDLYVIAADYNFGQITASWYRTVAEQEGYKIVNEEFIALEVSQFGSTINRIQEADPDLLVTLLVGTNHASFYDQKASAGLEVPMTTTINMAQGYEHLRFDPPALSNMHVGVNYMQEIPTDRNEAFVDRFYERWPDAEYVGQMAQNSYFTTYLYKQACEKAGTADQNEVMKVLDEEPTHHMTHVIRVARADENHNIEFTDTFESIEPFWLREGPGCKLDQVIGPSDEEHTTQFTPEDV